MRLVLTLSLVFGTGLHAESQTSVPSETRWGFVAPYSEDGEFERNSLELAASGGSVLAVHMDDCVPWIELLRGDEPPAWLRAGLLRVRERAGEDQSFYVAVTPTAQSRTELAPACGPHLQQTRPLPESLERLPFGHPTIRRLFLEHALWVVEVTRPDFLNIGIEVSELAKKNPEAWAEFEELFLYTLPRIKSTHPELQVGIEMVLQSLMDSGVRELVDTTYKQGDYLGISFYPYGDPFGRAEGMPGLPPPPDQWREPLAWLERYAGGKPIAICETGYLTRDATAFGIAMRGSEDLQEQFLVDLARHAERNAYPFVLWFVPMDFDRDLAALPAGYVEFKEAAKIWSTAGLWNEDRRPKKAHATWRTLLPER